MAAPAREIKSPCDKKVKLIKWKVRKGSVVSKGSIMALYSTIPDEGQGIISKLKATETGTVLQLVAEEGEVIPPFGTALLLQSQAQNVCTHPTIMKDMCADCGADLRKELGNAGDRKQSVTASVAMVHSIPELIVSQEQALELGKEDENRLLKERKLVLLVDLDQTLIHTTNDNIPPNLKDVKHFQLWHGKNYMWYHTRFRPFTEQFLQAVSKMYELHICTFGVRMYAHIIARLLDPMERYFSHRILSRDECFDSLSKTANLKALFPCGDTMVGIIDDREDVWNFAPNLVHVKPYRYFQGTADINAPPGLTKSENDDIPLKHELVNQKKESSTDGNDKDVGSKVKGQDNVDACDTSEKESSSTREDDNTVTGSDGISDDTTEQLRTAEDNLSSQENQTCEERGETNTGPDEFGQENRTVEEREEANNTAIAKDDACDEKVAKDGSCEETVLSASGVANEDESFQVETEMTTDEKGDLSGQDEKDGQKDEVRYVGDAAMEAGTDEGKGEEKKEIGDDDEIEWDDSDDYLLHLEEILRRIHTAYYDMYEQSQKSGSNQLPDLKNIIPYVKKKILKGANIVFSGMFPLNMPMEKSRAYITAKALGANIQNDIISSKSKQDQNGEATTHLIAAKPGTGKFKSAVKAKGVRVVSGDWLWACSERWEWVDERLYSFPSVKSAAGIEESGMVENSPKGSRAGKRKKPAVASAGAKNDSKVDVEEEIAAEGPEKSAKRLKNLDSDHSAPSSSTGVVSDSQRRAETRAARFSNSYNPLYSFSDEDIEFMDKEVDEIMAEDGGNSSDESEEERDSRLRKGVLGRSSSSDSDSDSLSGDFPRGWKMRRKSFSPHQSDHGSDRGRLTDEEVLDEETENELDQYQKTLEAFSPKDSESESNSDKDSIGSVDDEIAEAVEKEFLNSL